MDRNRYINSWRCPVGHVWLYAHDECPRCGGRLTTFAIRSSARIVTDTLVRVNPTGFPIHLGVAVATAGASTLCIIEGEIRGNGRDRVRLVVRGGRFHALASKARVQRGQSGSTRQSRRL